MRVTDTHAHFWDTSAFHYPWIEAGSPFDRTYTLQDYQQASSGLPIERMVFVECDADPKHALHEAQWIERLARSEPRIQGIVARVDLTHDDDLANGLDRLLQSPLVKGVRDNIQNHSPGFALQERFVRGVQEVMKRDLHFELCIKHHQMQETLQLVSQCAHGQFVLDHCGKPDIKAGIREPWRAQIRQLAEFPNVVCKISGLVTEADWQSWNAQQLLWYASEAAEAFGPERILFGSDWPVNEVAGGLRAWWEVVERLTQQWTPVDRHRFFWQNAERVYRLHPTA